MEVWKPIDGYDGIYEVSNMGRVRSLDQKVFNRVLGEFIRKGQILKPVPNSNGYLRVSLGYKKPKKRFFVHRLVAKAFIPNDNPEKNCVNHKDFDYTNNAAENLEWVTHLENVNYSYKKGRYIRTDEWIQNLRKTKEKKGKKIIGENIKNGEEIFFMCLNDCKKYGFQPSCVCDCCKGKRQTHKGYKWRYATPDELKRLKELWK